MIFVWVTCYKCGQKFTKELGRYNEAIKFGWKFYCSQNCQSKAKNRQILFKCGNAKCNNRFKRRLKEVPTSGICFCSRSCVAIINNHKSPKRRLEIRKCPTCGNTFTRDRKYCSLSCIPKKRLMSPKEIISNIQKFYKQYRRIPLKREFKHVKVARNQFGSWNKAIIASGFKPNPVKFARKHVAIDGHKCDSFAEFIIDNWLFTNNIQHKIHIPYSNSNMSSDFSIDGIRIEFIGLAGENRKYNRLLKIKRDMVRKRNLKVIEIYPEYLFPHNKLSKILTGVIK